jgi:hypothetical protein
VPPLYDMHCPAHGLLQNKRKIYCVAKLFKLACNVPVKCQLWPMWNANCYDMLQLQATYNEGSGKAVEFKRSRSINVRSLTQQLFITQNGDRMCFIWNSFYRFVDIWRHWILCLDLRDLWHQQDCANIYKGDNTELLLPSADAQFKTLHSFFFAQFQSKKQRK